jgi:hypothetical protein
MKNEFVRKWMRANLMGLLVGVVLGPILYHLIIYPQFWYLGSSFSDHPFHASNFDIISEFLVWTPIGASLGVAQQRLLREWKIKPLSWIIATSVGFTLPNIVVTWISPRIHWALIHGKWDNLVSDTMRDSQPFIIALSVALLQTWLLRRSTAKLGLWIWAHLVGVLIAIFLAFALLIVAFYIAEPVEKFAYAHDLYELVFNRDAITAVVIILALPFAVGPLVGFLTGTVLMKYPIARTIATEEVDYPISAQ